MSTCDAQWSSIMLSYILLSISIISHIDLQWQCLPSITKPLEWQGEKSHDDDETSGKQWEDDKQRRKKSLALPTMPQCRFKMNIQTPYRKPRATSWYAAKTFVPLLSMMIGLKLTRASHEHVTMNGIHVNITNAHTHKRTHSKIHYQKWRCGKMARISSVCVLQLPLFEDILLPVGPSILFSLYFLHRILDRLFYL